MCLENKITTFDHADIYGITHRGCLEKHFLPAKSLEKKLQFISNVGSKWLPRTVKQY
jgi:predicted oxidoreductase